MICIARDAFRKSIDAMAGQTLLEQVVGFYKETPKRKKKKKTAGMRYVSAAQELATVESKLACWPRGQLKAILMELRRYLTQYAKLERKRDTLRTDIGLVRIMMKRAQKEIQQPNMLAGTCRDMENELRTAEDASRHLIKMSTWARRNKLGLHDSYQRTQLITILQNARVDTKTAQKHAKRTADRYNREQKEKYRTVIERLEIKLQRMTDDIHKVWNQMERLRKEILYCRSALWKIEKHHRTKMPHISYRQWVEYRNRKKIDVDGDEQVEA